MANARLIVDIDDAECARHLDELIALLVVDLRAADEGDGVRAVAHELIAVRFVLTDPVLVTRLLQRACRAVDGLLPANLHPPVAAGRAVHRALRPLRRVWDVSVTKPLRA